MFNFLFNMITTENHNSLMIGENGVGKTNLIKNFLTELDT